MLQRTKHALLLAIILSLAACASTKPLPELKSNIAERKSAEELIRREPKSDEFKTYLFQRSAKLRLTNDPSSKIIKQFEEGTQVIAYIAPAGDGWFYFKNKSGEAGFYFGNAAIQVSK
jgi:cytochrome c biogenesis protein ResB